MNSVKAKDYLEIRKFETAPTSSDKIQNLFNEIIVLTSLFGVFSLISGSGGLWAYVSYVSLGLTARKIASIVIGYFVYPAALTSFPFYSRKELKSLCKRNIAHLETDGYLVNKFKLYHAGTRYAAICIAHESTKTNGNWSIHALGNGMCMENHISEIAKNNFSNKSNTLLINGPAVCASKGWPTRDHMAHAFKTGLVFLEQEVGAKRILMDGYSLGGGMIGEAICEHEFNLDCHYMAVFGLTFSSLAKVAAEITGIPKFFFYLTNTNLNSYKAVEKLDSLGIESLITQHRSDDIDANDGVIPDSASLGRKIQKKQREGLLTHAQLLESSEIRHHFNDYPEDIQNLLNQKIKEFFRS